MIPQSPEKAGIEQNPTIVQLKEAVEGLEGLKNTRIAFFQEQDEKVKTFTAIEELMLVHQNSKHKGEVFQEAVTKFQQEASAFNDMENQRNAFITNIQNLLGPFQQVLASVQNDQGQIQFYQQID